MPRGGRQPGSGNPGYGKINMIRDGVNKLTPLWFVKVEEMMKSNDKNDQKFAISELAKLMGRMIPQQLGGLDGEPITVKMINYGDRNTVQISTKVIPDAFLTSVG